MLRRLTHSQYNNTVRDLLGDQTAPANQFPPEDFVDGFKDQYNAQNLSPLLAEAYSTAAEKIATKCLPEWRYARFNRLQAVGRMPRQVHPRLRAASFPAAARFGRGPSLHAALLKRNRFYEKRAAGGGSHAAIAKFSFPPGRHNESEMETVCRRQPLVLSAVGQHARRCVDGRGGEW